VSSGSFGSVFPFTNPSGKTVYKVQIPIGQYPNGLRKFITRTAPTEAKAKALQRQLLNEIDNNKHIPAREDKLEKFAIWWVRSVKANRVRSSTASNYEYRLRRWILPYLGQYKLSSIEPPVIEQWMNDLKVQGLGTKTINGARAVVSGVLGYAHKSGIIKRNPTLLVSPHRRKRNEKTQVNEPWTTEELTKALMAVHHTKFDLLTHLGALYGLRRGEILGLQWSDLDLESGVLSIRRTLKETRVYNEAGFSRSILETEEPKTKRSARRIQVGETVMHAFLRHREYVDQMAEAAGTKWTHSDWLIPSETGGAWNPNNALRQFKTFCHRAGIRVVRIHDLRHTAAVQGLSRGVRLEAVSQALGHSRTETTTTIYAPNVQTLNDEFTTTVDAGFTGTLLVQHDHEMTEWGNENGSLYI
jgi:integrase